MTPDASQLLPRKPFREIQRSTIKLTQTAIPRLILPKGGADKIYFDDDLPGFGVRLREGGSRKYVVHYRQGGIQRRYTIGSTATLTLEEARRKARRVLVAVDDGKDPATEKANRHAASGLIFGAVVDDYLAFREKDLRASSLKECKRYLRAAWKPLQGMALGAVSRPVIAARLRQLAEERGPASANRARSTLSALFAWAIGEGLCETNAAMGTNLATENGPRKRVLSDMELATIWKAAPDNDYGRIIKLLMLTGQRREEIGALRWSEIDTEAKQITLPPARTKNGVEHVIPLSDAALAILAIPRLRDLVFGHGANGLSGWSRGKTALDRACEVKDWTVHDLRRSAATGMADIGVQPHIIEAVLNHVSGHKAGVAGIYNRSTYATEKRAALDLWASHIRLIVAQSEGANVTALNRRSTIPA
jgi:integrase